MEEIYFEKQKPDNIFMLVAGLRAKYRISNENNKKDGRIKASRLNMRYRFPISNKLSISVNVIVGDAPHSIFRQTISAAVRAIALLGKGFLPGTAGMNGCRIILCPS